MHGYNKLRKRARYLLNNELPDNLYYHSIRHTTNALKNCEAYIKYFNLDSNSSKLLRIAILLHDVGFTVSYINHEIEGAKIANELMTEFGFPKSEIKVVTRLILATQLPQKPQSLLEKIICDVDLDYLGRKDFYKTSDLLYQELLERSDFFDRNEWNRIQIEFLENHTYHTEFAKERRQENKEQRIEELKFAVSSNNRKII